MSGTILIQRKSRKHLTAEQKLAIVQASYEPGALIAEVARQYDVGVSSLLKWRKRATEGSLMGVKHGSSWI